MSDFNSLRVKVGRRPITIVEIDLDLCLNTYGTAPCTAAVGTTGTSKCYNTFKTCQSVPNFSRGTKTYSFCSNNAFLPISPLMFACVTDVDITPTKLVPEGLSVSSAVNITLQDFPYHDRGIDPYYSSRSFDPMAQGSFFGRLRARNPYLVNRVMRVKTGYVDDTRAVFTMTRTYFIDHIEGPDSDGKVTLVGKDPLRFADKTDLKVPVETKLTLGVPLSTQSDAITVLPVGIGPSLATSGSVRIDDEIISYTGVTGDILTGLTRAAFNTTIATHDVSAKVQVCKVYANATVPTILYDLIVNEMGIASGYVTLSDWSTEADTWLPGFLCTVVISDPTTLTDVIGEVLQSSGSSVWWNEEGAQFRFKVIIPFLIKQDVPILTEVASLIAGSVSMEDKEDERVSRVLTYFNVISQVADVDKTNFNNLAIQIDADSESANAYGTPQALEILSRWTPSEAQANAVSGRLLSRKVQTPREITIQLDAKDNQLKVGDLRDISTRLLQDFDGANFLMRFMVTEAHEVDPGTLYEYVMIQVAPRGGGRAALFAPDTTNDWTAATATEKATYLYFSNDNGFMSDGSVAPRLC